MSIICTYSCILSSFVLFIAYISYRIYKLAYFEAVLSFCSGITITGHFTVFPSSIVIPIITVIDCHGQKVCNMNLLFHVL